jgi:hypothetical protein
MYETQWTVSTDSKMDVETKQLWQLATTLEFEGITITVKVDAFPPADFSRTYFVLIFI